MSCVGCRNRFAPLTLASCGRSRSMICGAVGSRSSRGLSTMKKRRYWRSGRRRVPVNEPNPAISGSRSMTSPNSRRMRIIRSGAASCAASAKPEIRPVSWIGKKPFGIMTIITAVNAMVAKKTVSVTKLVAHDVERAPVERQHGVEAGLDHPGRRGRARPTRAHEARAQHRGERERHQRRDGDRGRDGQGEFAEQAADDAAHQQQRDEHRDQRQADRDHGEADLARALDRGLERTGSPSSMWR